MKALTNRTLLFVSLALTAYFTLLFLNAYVFKLDNVVLGVFQQLLTIPFLIMLLFFLGVSIRRVVKEGLLSSNYLSVAFAFFLISTLGTFGSFIIAFAKV